MIKSLEIIKEKTHEECSKLLLEKISKQINKFENFSIGLSGGSTPKLFYELFAKKFNNHSNISLWTVDERHIDTSENISNQNMINSILLRQNWMLLNIFIMKTHIFQQKVIQIKYLIK